MSTYAVLPIIKFQAPPEGGLVYVYPEKSGWVGREVTVYEPDPSRLIVGDLEKEQLGEMLFHAASDGIVNRLVSMLDKVKPKDGLSTCVLVQSPIHVAYDSIYLRVWVNAVWIPSTAIDPSKRRGDFSELADEMGSKVLSFLRKTFPRAGLNIRPRPKSMREYDSPLKER